MLNYPQVHTDMVFEIIPTVPLEQRAGIECKVHHNTVFNNPTDGDEIMSLSYTIREEKEFPPWRQHRDPELLILQGLFSSKISIDKITRFSVRPPELRELFRQVGNYYRWFIIINKRLGRERLENVLDDSIWNSLWVDGLQNQVCLWLNALPEVIEFLELQDIPEDNQNSRYVMKTYFKKVSHYHNMFSENENYGSETDHELWAFMKNDILHDDDLRHLPIPVFSYVRPTMGPRFILHLMLSMGEFDTELDLILHRTLRDSLRYAKLIGLNDDEDSLQEYANSLLKKFILEQLQYISK